MDAEISSIMDPSIANMSTPPYPDMQPAQEDVDEVLRKKRKAREHKACYPCRQRKVKCDLTRPCKTCREREHPELCSFNPPNKIPRTSAAANSVKGEDATSNGGTVTISKGEFDFLCRKLNALENSIADLRQQLGLRPQHSDLNGDTNAGSSNIDPAVEGRPRRPTHTDIHGVHVKNDAVSGEDVPSPRFQS